MVTLRGGGVASFVIGGRLEFSGWTLLPRGPLHVGRQEDWGDWAKASTHQEQERAGGPGGPGHCRIEAIESGRQIEVGGYFRPEGRSPLMTQSVSVTPRSRDSWGVPQTRTDRHFGVKKNLQTPFLGNHRRPVCMFGNNCDLPKGGFISTTCRKFRWPYFIARNRVQSKKGRPKRARLREGGSA